MKLNTEWVDRTQEQFAVQAVPETHPAAKDLRQLFGDHTFFLGVSGLHVVVPSEEEADSPVGSVLKVARWQNDQRETLVPHEPEPVGQVTLQGRA